MTTFNEATLEKAIMELFQEIKYEYVSGDNIHREVGEVLLLDDLRNYLKLRYSKFNITNEEINDVIAMLKNYAKNPIYDANKKILDTISNGFILKRRDPLEKDLFINLIDFNDINNNTFKIVNQFEIKEVAHRIPDAVVFINGLPLVVFEFKSAVKKDTTIKDAYTQLCVRYKREIPTILKYNAFLVISDGVNNKYGSLFSKYDFFYSWRKINDDSVEVDGIDSLYSMIKGMFDKNRLVNIIKDYIYFPDTSQKELKIVCRYPQFYATNKLYENIKLHKKPQGDGKGGTYFGATGCGKSYTMLFLTRKLMKDTFFASPTIILITDRTDLDFQLAEQFTNSKDFVGDKLIKRIESRAELRELLNERPSGGVFLTTIQKFTEDTLKLSDRTNIICISDEAHRSQVGINKKMKKTSTEVEMKYGYAKFLHDSLPNATYVGFTGTPIDATLEVFGNVVDAYTMKESVRDGITVNIVYEGRSAKVLLDNDKLQEIEQYYIQCANEGANEYQIEESKKAVSKLEVIIGDPNRLKAVAKDLIAHYEERVNEKATIIGKAMVVCMTRPIAFLLYKEILKLRPEWAKSRLAPGGVTLTEADKRKLKSIPMINMVMTKDKDDEDELYEILSNTKSKDELDRQFKFEKSNFKIAIVVDMWLTGFDVPCLDTMYIDKPLQQHNLIQTISRVNRVYPGKEKGLVVDYFGIKSQMNTALKMYNNGDREVFEGIEEAVKIVKDEISILDKLFRNFNSLDFFNGTPVQKLECLNKAAEYAQLTKELENRFMAHAKKLKSAYNLCSYSDMLTDDDRDKVMFYSAVRSIIFKLTKGEAPDIHRMNEKVKQMIAEAIKSDGVEEVFKLDADVDTRIVDIFSDEYIAKINSIPLINTKVKLLTKLLKDAIEAYKRVNKIKGVQFSERLQKLVDMYNERQDEKVYAAQVLEDVAQQLADLLKELQKDKESFKDLGIDFEEKAFFDILEAIAKKHNFYDEYIGKHGEEHLINLSKEIKIIVDDKAKYTDWSKKQDIKDELKVGIILKLAEYGYPPVTVDEVYKEVFEQAENFKKYNE